jgi:hypothetical protein
MRLIATICTTLLNFTLPCLLAVMPQFAAPTGQCSNPTGTAPVPISAAMAGSLSSQVTTEGTGQRDVFIRKNAPAILIAADGRLL